MPARPWAQQCPGRSRALAEKQRDGLLPLTSGNAKNEEKADPGREGEVEADESWEEEEEEAEMLAEAGVKPSLSCCVCVCRRRLLAPADGLDEGRVRQSPTRVLLGWDEERQERCVVGPRGLDWLNSQGSGGNSKAPRSAGSAKGEGAMPMAGLKRSRCALEQKHLSCFSSTQVEISSLRLGLATEKMEL